MARLTQTIQKFEIWNLKFEICSKLIIKSPKQRRASFLGTFSKLKTFFHDRYYWSCGSFGHSVEAYLFKINIKQTKTMSLEQQLLNQCKRILHNFKILYRKSSKTSWIFLLNFFQGLKSRFYSGHVHSVIWTEPAKYFAWERRSFEKEVPYIVFTF